MGGYDALLLKRPRLNGLDPDPARCALQVIDQPHRPFAALEFPPNLPVMANIFNIRCEANIK